MELESKINPGINLSENQVQRLYGISRYYVQKRDKAHYPEIERMNGYLISLVKEDGQISIDEQDINTMRKNFDGVRWPSKEVSTLIFIPPFEMDGFPVRQIMWGLYDSGVNILTVNPEGNMSGAVPVYYDPIVYGPRWSIFNETSGSEIKRTYSELVEVSGRGENLDNAGYFPMEKIETSEGGIQFRLPLSLQQRLGLN